MDQSVQWVPGATSSTTPTTVSGDATGGVLTIASFSSPGCFLCATPAHDTRYGEIAGATWADCNGANGASVSSWSLSW